MRVTVTATIELLDGWLTDEPHGDPAEIATLFARLVMAPLAERRRREPA